MAEEKADDGNQTILKLIFQSDIIPESAKEQIKQMNNDKDSHLKIIKILSDTMQWTINSMDDICTKLQEPDVKKKRVDH